MIVASTERPSSGLIRMFLTTPATRTLERGSVSEIGITSGMRAIQPNSSCCRTRSGGRERRSKKSLNRPMCQSMAVSLGRERGGKRGAVHVIIAGCGRVGSDLAASLEGQGHSVAVIDKNPRAFERLKDSFQGKKLEGFVFDKDIMEEAGINEATAFASVTSGDNSNIVSARMAKEHYRVELVVARIYDPRRAQIYQRLGIQTVATVRWTTDQIMRALLPEERSVEWTIDNGEVVITAIPAPAETVGRQALELDRVPERRVIAISRFGVPRIPDKELAVQEGDIIHFSCARGAVSSVVDELRTIGKPE